MAEHTPDPALPATAAAVRGQAIPTALVGLDWGSSALRGYRFGAGGEVLERRSSPHGVLNLPAAGAAGFRQALEELCGDWLRDAPQAPLLACGMVGSAQGWREVAYLELPAGAEQLVAGLEALPLEGGRLLHLVPGLVQRGMLPNVMRGEETQVAGALDGSAAEGLLVGLPGTHSKWVRVEGGRIVHFDTFMTGELYALLSRQSILARTLERGGPFDAAAFDFGLAVARAEDTRAGLLATVFSTRTLGLTGQLGAAAQADYLSGLLIGHELAALRRLLGADAAPPPAVLIGGDELCRRYARALAAHGFTHVEAAARATERGLWRIAAGAGLVAGAAVHPANEESFHVQS
jgi:2-dehydro-3-deoxygalactonokinase